jgi:nucleotide-binding universal stress UspA family protein
VTARPPYTHIACFIDGSDAARQGLDHAEGVRALTGGRLSVVHVIAAPAFLVTLAAGLGGGAAVHDPETEREAARMWLEEQVRDREGAEAVLLEGHPGSAACDWSAGHGVDLMVAARHRGLVERTLLGSFAGHIAHNAPCPVLLVPPGDGP